jgi:serine/threonine protein kinase
MKRALDTGSGDLTPLEGTLRARRVKTSGINTIRGGRYRIDALLGEGGMSVVYGAYDTLLERDVALKELRLDTSIDSDVIVREARVLAAVQHPNVVAVHGLHFEAGAHETGRRPFFVMERVRGETLDAYAKKHHPNVRECIELLAQAAAGIDAIHGAGLVHGDVKPSNVLIDRAGVVKIADVGLVPLLEHMKAGEILGTPAYMSPERAVGALPERLLAARSDVYSFAVVAMELLTGHQPFAPGTTDELLRAHATQMAPRVSRVSTLARTFDEPFQRALSKSPAMRPESCRAFVAQLRRASLGTDQDGVALRILVVDDDGDQRMQLAETLALRLRGAVIESASDGESALDAVSRKPAIAILDLSMPGLCGIPLIQKMRERAPRTAIIVVTGHGSGAEWREARALGVRRFFVKPVESPELARAIREIADEAA